MNWFERLIEGWHQRKERRRQAPPPALEVPFTAYRASEELVEVVVSPAGTERAGITRDERGVYRVYTERWAEDWDFTGCAEWTGSGGHDGSLTDTLDRARIVARERLRHTTTSSY
jgi:hypothetical protein